MYISFNISMEFELHGVKFKYEDGVMYRWYEYSCKNNWRKNHSKWKILGGEKRKDGYVAIRFKINNIRYNYLLHRIVYWIHNPDWDIYNSSTNNSIDHIDGNTRNNNIENLRVVTNQENSFNTKAKGYYFIKDVGKWSACITINNKTKHLGRFDNKEDAHQAYLDAKEIYHII